MCILMMPCVPHIVVLLVTVQRILEFVNVDNLCPIEAANRGFYTLISVRRFMLCHIKTVFQTTFISHSRHSASGRRPTTRFFTGCSRCIRLSLQLMTYH